jgi:hypothetical protein
VLARNNPGPVHDLAVPAGVLARLTDLKLSEIAEAADCSKASESKSDAGSGRRVCRYGGNRRASSISRSPGRTFQ